MTDREALEKIKELCMCNGCKLYIGKYCGADKSYEPNGQKHWEICMEHRNNKLFRIEQAVNQALAQPQQKTFTLDEVREVITETSTLTNMQSFQADNFPITAAGYNLKELLVSNLLQEFERKAE